MKVINSHTYTPMYIIYICVYKCLCSITQWALVWDTWDVWGELARHKDF